MNVSPDSRVYVGTCSWADRSLLACGEFYPREVAGDAAKRLRHYASRFPTVEVDSPFYAIPREQTVAAWAERVPPGFVMHVKAFGALTGHAIQAEALPADLRSAGLQHGVPEGADGRLVIRDRGLLREIAGRFLAVSRPLERASRLGFFVFQFSPRFSFEPKRLDLLGTLCEWMSPCRLAFEFRHASWLEAAVWPAVLGRIRDLGQVVVTADEPQIGSPLTIPFRPAVTSGVGYLRLHGRNRGNWFRRDIATSLRYDYSYDENELREFVEAVAEMRRESSRIFVMFNNCHEASGVKNALLMQEMLETCQPGAVQRTIGRYEGKSPPRQHRLTDTEERDDHEH